MPYKQPLFTLLTLLLLYGCSSTAPKKQQTLKETIPITMANLRGHKSLYNEGWFVVSSTKDALSFAKKHGVNSAGKALKEALSSMKDDSKEYGKDLKKNVTSGYETTKKILKKGSQNSLKILEGTQKLVEIEVDYAKKSFVKAWSRFYKGNISLGERTREDWESIVKMPGNYFDDLKKDFSNIDTLSNALIQTNKPLLSNIWENSFSEAKKSFLASYEQSGESDNSLGGLFHIMYGYFKALFHGAVKPTAKSVVKGALYSGSAVMKIGGKSISLLGRSVESLGLTLYHVSSVGVKIVSPTVEAGFLSALSFLSLGSTGITYVGGGTLGLMNQVGTMGVAPVAGVGETTLKTAYDTTKLVTFLSYDIIKGSSKIIFHEAASGVVLGYNALTALPTQALLAASDSVFFLAWDGPRLVVAAAKGEIAEENINKLPVGSVLDLKMLNQDKGVKVKVISEDYNLIEEILHRLPADMKVK